MREDWWGPKGRGGILNSQQWRRPQRARFGDKEPEQTKGPVKNKTVWDHAAFNRRIKLDLRNEIVAGYGKKKNKDPSEVKML